MRNAKTGRRFDEKRVASFLAEKSPLRNPQLVAILDRLGAALGMVTAPGESVAEAIVSTIKAMSPEVINAHRRPGERVFTAEEIQARMSEHFGIPAETLRSTVGHISQAVLQDMTLEHMAQKDFALPDGVEPTEEAKPTMPDEKIDPADPARHAKEDEQRRNDVRAAAKSVTATEPAKPVVKLPEASSTTWGETPMRPSTHDDVRAAFDALSNPSKEA